MSTIEREAVSGITLFTTASTYDKAWDIAVKCRRDGETDITAIKRVYDALMPPALISTVATIVGAIYADSYWTSVKLDPQLLANSLQKAKGWSAVECMNAAQKAFQSWYGLLMRNDFNDVGRIPKAGVLTYSPDALCNMDGPLEPSEMLRQWNSYFFNQAVVGKNYCYARAQQVNLPVDLPEARARMFYTDAGFNQPPNSWQILYTFDGDQTSPLTGMTAGPIHMNDRVASGAFNFEPPQAKHYCLLAVAQTEFFANEPLQWTGNWDSATWITYNGAAAWHNIDVTSGGTTRLVFHNQDATSERFSFEAHCHRLPAGTRVVLAPLGDGLEVAARAVRIERDAQVVVSNAAEIPGSFAGELEVTIETPDGAPLPREAVVELRMVWSLPVGHTHHADAVERFGLAAQGPARVQLGHYTFVGSGK
jgi:hypothetical protein